MRSNKGMFKDMLVLLEAALKKLPLYINTYLLPQCLFITNIDKARSVKHWRRDVHTQNLDTWVALGASLTAICTLFLHCSRNEPPPPLRGHPAPLPPVSYFPHPTLRRWDLARAFLLSFLSLFPNANNPPHVWEPKPLFSPPPSTPTGDLGDEIFFYSI